MAGRLIAAQHAAVTAATSGGLVTIASTTGWYAGAHGWLSKAGSNQRIVVVSIPSGTTLNVRIDTYPNGDVVQMTYPQPNYGLSDVSAYNAGSTIDQDAQLIFNVNDAPLT